MLLRVPLYSNRYNKEKRAYSKLVTDIERLFLFLLFLA